jgi:hypothetical protein
MAQYIIVSSSFGVISPRSAICSNVLLPVISENMVIAEKQ